ncbi:MAG TPA: O-antigen polymerase [Terriglobales bacterium]|nr:O-antigen polymerase [Terriglobales bacterium]
MAFSLFNAVLLDATVVICCVACLAAFARLSVTHPATVYFAFHCGFISVRALAILNGATTLFSWKGSIPVSEVEISRAMMLADLALIAMTCAWILASHRAATLALTKRLERPRALQPEILKLVAAICIPAGCVAMLLWSRFPGVPAQPIEPALVYSNWAIIAQTWAGLSLLALIYWYGFKPSLVISLSAYMGWVIYQGNFRFRLLIPLILLMQIYVDRRGRRWPSAAGIAGLLVSALLFFPLKGIGQRLQASQPIGDVWESAQSEIAKVFHGDHPDEMILDQFASALTLADAHGHLYWGRTYEGLLTVVVPRQWWPEKPGLTRYEHEISTKERPMADDGMVVTMLGEFYLNFSYPGIVIMSFAWAYLMGVWFEAVYRAGYFSLIHFSYLLVASNLIQVFRDGLISLFVFTIINMLPLAVIVALHFFSRRTSGVLYTQPILKTPRVRKRVVPEPIASQESSSS